MFAVLDIDVNSLAGAERNSALQRAGLAQVMPTHKRHFVPRDLQFLTSNTYRRTKLLESDRLLAAELRSVPAGGFWAIGGLDRAHSRVTLSLSDTQCLREGPPGSEPFAFTSKLA